ISKKHLNSVFTSDSDDVPLPLRKDSIEFSSISEIPEDYQLGESAESFVASVDPLFSPSLESSALSDLTALTSTITADNDEVGDNSVGHCNSAESKSRVDIVSVDAEMVVHHLKQARVQIRNSTNADLQSKKLLDALIEGVIEDFNALPAETDRFAELVSMKTRVVFVSFFMWILAVSAVLIFSSGVRNSFTEPPPT
ncbi:hypothetical protein U1Q18_029922, partial [Sarracenia purpurea var. burkii]